MSQCNDNKVSLIESRGIYSAFIESGGGIHVAQGFGRFEPDRLLCLVLLRLGNLVAKRTDEGLVDGALRRGILELALKLKDCLALVGQR